LGKTNYLTEERKEYIKIEEVLNELKSWFNNNIQEAKNLNYITISGSGEPTLNTKIGELITEIKKITAIPVAVITNASLLSNREVRASLLGCDLILPSLDTVLPEIFAQINRPYRRIKIDEIINGLISFKNEFRGKIWLEVMLVRGVNDDLSQIKKLKEAIDKINPDKIQLNSPVRTTAQENVLPVEHKKLEKIKELLGDRCQII
jgi:wyosine [tRNA(Phe)-imidazoG37] synthetase (radical SAM superfamily)